MPAKIIVIAHNLRSAHNVGSLLRTCEGIGVEKLYFTGYTPYPASNDDKRLPHIASKIDKQIEKTALGAQNYLQWQYSQDLDSVLDKVRSDSYVVCALEQSSESLRLDKFKVPPKVALILGNEVDGLEPDVLDGSDFILEIPMYGRKESFNVIQAAAMSLYKFRFDSP